MKKYKGYYIGEGCFKNKKEIDEFLKAQAIESYRTALKCFDMDPCMESSVICSERADKLAYQFGLTRSEIETIEIETFKSLA